MYKSWFENETIIIVIRHTDEDVSSCEAGVSHPADQRWPRSPDASLAVINIVNVSSVQPFQVGPTENKNTIKTVQLYAIHKPESSAYVQITWLIDEVI